MSHEEKPIPNDQLTDQQTARIAQLAESDLRAIDEALLANAKRRWQKAAMVIATTMFDYGKSIPDIPDTFYNIRLRKLVDEGRLEAQGNLDFMRFSEVRLPE